MTLHHSVSAQVKGVIAENLHGVCCQASDVKALNQQLLFILLV